MSIPLWKPQNATKDTNLETRPAAPAFSARKLSLSNPGPSDENKTENASITRLHWDTSSNPAISSSVFLLYKKQKHIS